ncbi:polysaccharide deacetylase family protein [Nocardioides rubriscoriae]|uniref:polysaccharide deacetylase family protein n=1 Tax=Nocardioides rubriscoriae TaxID=642762 RepID=UPI0011DF810D|nr:polysaccharide deacetylase family protein [Nocardioides rubriscoriae]
MSVLGRAAAPLGAAGRLATGRAARGGAVVLCYHDVVADDAVADGLEVTASALRSHLRTVRSLGFRIVALGEISERVTRGEPVDGLAAVAFDDALAGVARHAMPVLVDLEVPASLMTVSTGWGRRPPWWPGAARTMTRAELVEAVAHGLELAAHTRTHASLADLDAARLADEVGGCRAELEDVTGHRITQFAYPFGHHDRAVREAVEAAGFTAAYTFLNGRITLGDDLLRLPRLTMGAHHTRARLAYHLGRSPASWPDHQLDRVVASS